MNPYASLFRPLKVGGITLKNRLLSSPTSTSGFDAAGHYSDEIISYYRLKALGGTSLVTVGEGIVDLKTGRSKPVQIDLSDPTAEVSMRNLASAIHAGGAMASIQLDHGGALALPKLMGHPAMGPCTYTNHRGDPVVAMTDEDIHRIAEAYGKAAANAKKYGFDMVMLHGGHGWLIHQFISEITNHRTDKWGGSLENRLRFPLLVIEEVRKAVGPKFPIDIRISGSERCPGGYGIETGVEIAKAIDGKVDMIHVSAGTMMDVYSAVLMHPGIFQKPGENSAFAAEIKKHVKTPVCTVGAFSDPDFMVRYLEETGVDAIAMGRALIADPFLPKKLMRGERENITPCLRCTECLSGLQQKERMVCAVNPIIGREKDYFAGMPVRREHRKVLVVGGGPAGIEAALTADSLGHQVTLCEKTGRLGGMLRFADAGDFKSLMKEYRDNQIEKLQKSGVTVKLHTTVDEALIQELAPDAMILAVGAKPFVPPIPGIDGANVIPGCDLVGNELSGRKVTVLGGGLVGCEEALQLARSGYDVSIVEMQRELAPDASAMHRKNLLRQIQDQENITLYLSARCTGISEHAVTAQLTDGSAVELPTDWVVLCAGLRAKTDVVDQLRVLVPETYVIGDCAGARNVVAATREGYDTAVALGQ